MSALNHQSTFTGGIMGTLDGDDTGDRSWLELSLVTFGCVGYFVVCVIAIGWFCYTLVGCVMQFTW
jgi:hypothetical protein